MSRTREQVRRWAGAVLGDRPVPVGRVACDRRLLRRAAGTETGRVLVLGPGLATRQALTRASIDVAGTNPHVRDVTVCSLANGPRSLPAGRWDLVVVAELGPEPLGRVHAAARACRPGGRLFVMDREGWAADAPVPTALREQADVRTVLRSRADWLWLAERRP